MRKRPGELHVGEATEPQRLLDNPDPDAIEQSAVWQLARALNIGRVIAFVGAGVPMAYGRISWRGLVEMLAEEVGARCGTEIKRVKGRSRKELLKALNGRVSIMKQEDAGADQYPTLFQLTEQLDKELTRSKTGNSKGIGLRQQLAANVYDDRGQGKELFRRAFSVSGGLSYKFKEFVNDSFKLDSAYDTHRSALDAIETDASKPYRPLFTKAMLRQAAEASRNRLGATSDVLPLVEALEALDNGCESNLQLTAVHRFAVVCLLRLATDTPGKIKALLRATKPRGNGKTGTAAERKLSRHDLIPEARDPLLIMHNGLHIHRYLTTNYDLDIERLFRDMGFVTKPEPSQEEEGWAERPGARTDRIDALGGRSRELVVTPAGHGRLLDFATQDRPAQPQVVHLHGRATSGDHDQIVVTEQDYQALYQREGIDRQPMDVARRVAFGGNPLLFVGLGLGEDDILRPLRQFMGQESRLGDRLAVAIMPGLKRIESRLLEQMTLLNRYGVYGIYYGSAMLRPGSKKVSDWLARLFEIADAVVAVARAAAKDDAGKNNDIAARYSDKKAAFDKIFHNEVRIIDETGRVRAPNEIDGVDLALHRMSLKAELHILSTCIQLVRGTSDWDPAQFRTWKAIEIAVDGVKTCVQSVCLCARLKRLETEWRAWKRGWFTLPDRRELTLNAIPKDGTSATGKRTRRTGPAAKWLDGCVMFGWHVVDLPDLPGFGGKITSPDRFYRNPPSRALNVFKGGMAARGPDFWNQFRGRRVFVLLGRPGVGKGHIFSSLTSSNALEQFVAASWGTTIKDDSPATARYVGAAFFNLSFSHEVASVFDRLTVFLERSWDRMFGSGLTPETLQAVRAVKARFYSRRQHFLNDRRRRLKTVCEAYARAAKLAPDCKTRVLIAISNVSALYDEDGEPKNTGLGRMVEELLEPALSAMPVDFVMICATGSVPRMFRAGEHAFRAEDAQCKPEDPAMLRLLPRPSTARHQATVIEQERLLQLVECKDTILNHGSVARAGIVVCHLLRRARTTTLATAFFPRVGLAVAADEFGVDDYQPVSPAELVAVQAEVRDAIVDEIETAAVERLLSTLQSEQAAAQGTGPYHRSRRDQERLIQRFRATANTISRNRFATTLLLSAADEEIGPRHAGLKQADGQKAVEFLEGVRTQMLGSNPAARDSLVVTLALAAMERRHRERKDCPIDLPCIRKLSPLSHRLLLQILWHVAVIGEPVGKDVLALCPGIKAALNDLRTGAGAGEIEATPSLDDDARDLALMQDALDLLVHRCLLFPSGLHYDDKWHSRRYGIHRLARRVVFQRLEASLDNQRILDRYSLSLYIAQPSDLPRPTWEAHERLRALVHALSGYPDTPLPDKLSPEEGRLWSRRLRAANGVICSVFHVAIIGRFDEYGSQDAMRRPPLGFFESHRLLVRWLFRQAVKFGQISKEAGVGELGYQPFYAEEIVWLLNESGVLSLAQGRLDDATSLFDQALDAARQWLAPHDAALAARIGLNAAMAHIERGDAGRARTVLTAVLSHRDEHRVVRGTAEGLLGLADHLAGELDSAERHYQAAVSLLLAASSTRAASIFKRHMGDLRRARGPEHHPEAREILTQAENLAREGAHEDAAQLIRLSHAKLMISGQDPHRLTAALRVLDGVQTYGQKVGLPRLLAEVALIRSEAVLLQGETKRATELAAEALEISTLHDLRLFKTRALGALSRAFQHQGVTNAADLVRRRGEELARRSRYTSMAKALSSRDDGSS